MTLDELKAFTAELQSIFDRVPRPLDADDNVLAGAALLIFKHGMQLASRALVMMATSTPGVDYDAAVEAIREIFAARPHEFMVVPSGSSDLATRRIRKRAGDGFPPDRVATKVEGIQ